MNKRYQISGFTSLSLFHDIPQEKKYVFYSKI